ncbi:MAG: imidazolonepropionase [Candidatus Marinimicrobia bacterium]|nr:imidazolonepropionase [Candidatus Neomarinimicrobiota bacterium]
MSTIKLTNIGSIATYNSNSKTIDNIKDRDILINNGLIEKIDQDITSEYEIFDCKNKLITPGFVDPHTHPVFHRGREEEFSLRLQGATYQEIAAKGGGINSSINGVRNSSTDELVQAVMPRMDRFLKLGTTTIEAKSGYGLNVESELKSLEVLDLVNKNHAIDIIPTFLGAHAIPPEYKNNHDDYIDLICNDMIPAVAKQGIAKYCDVFCENGYFNVNQARRILTTAKNHDLISRLHADEFEDSGAAELAAELGAVSADHLMAVSDIGIKKLADGNVSATLLPGTTFFLGSTNYAPIKKLINAGVTIALATDYNPGSCHIQSMPFILSLACIYLGMSVEDALMATTYNSASTLNLENETGSIEVGKKADLIIWDLEKLIEIPYNVTDVPIMKVMKRGKFIN